MRVAVAGTFDVLHDGHRALINRAFEIGGHVSVGITSDRMASQKRENPIPLSIRMSALEKFLSGMKGNWEIFVIDDIYGPKENMDSVDVLVVSEETLPNGKKLNEERKSRGVPPLEFSVVPLVMASDGSKISSKGILEGRYGKDGDADVPDISVGSLNPVKTEAVRAVMEKIYGNVRITSVDVESGVPEQPFEKDVRQGAVNRAKSALGNHEMSVGIEAGVFELEDGLYDIQYCAVFDNKGMLTIGMGSGFRYPDDISASVREGKTVSDAIRDLYGREDIGKKGGAIGLLTDGLLNRKELTEQSIMAAMVPRISDSLGY
jgi:inosine/xanthosine triphosphatase